MQHKKLSQIAVNGLLNENPTFRLVLGMCPTLAVTTSLINGVGMGLATTFVLFCSNLLISLLKNIIPDKVRIPAFILVIATFVTIVEMVMNKYMEGLYQALGLYIPLIVVNCIIFARAESFASVNPVLPSMVDGLSMGLGFTAALAVLGSIRELLAYGKLGGIVLLGEWFPGIAMLGTAPGGFLTLGLCMALFNYVYGRVTEARAHKKQAKAKEENV
ncbi:MAG: electron transport complex subunit E [Clostridia bacterium]|nr:electron transport complex subunit E [Clostridia bacterium]